MQIRLDWHSRRNRPDGTTDHEIMKRLQKELSDLVTQTKLEVGNE